ncbi:MAG: hypothetical protein JWP18_1551 [Solirubrobacterales bacterium]|nr:hypothetical protein [Solirubrobacterales bacterium]
MELRSILQQLLRHRRLAALGVVPALLAGMLLAFRVSSTGIASRSNSTVSASVQVLLRSTDAPPFDLAPRTVDSGARRAELLAHLMASDAVRKQIARGGALAAPAALTIVTPASDSVPELPPIALEARAIGAPRTPFVLEVKADGNVPIMGLKATAPTAAAAISIARAAASTLDRLLTDDSPPTGPRLGALALGAPTAQAVANGSKLPAGIAGALAVFGLWCAVVVVLTGLRRDGPGRAPV